MADLGGPSQMAEDVQVDKHVIHVERPIAEPVVEPRIEAEFDAEADPEEDLAIMAVEPVEDGEDDQMQESEDDDTEGSEDEEPEEALPGAGTLGYLDDMGTTADDIIDELTTRNGELEERVHHLEEQNQVHQDLEQQYKDVAYQALGEKTELEEVVRQKDQRIAELQAQLMAMSVEFDLERMDRVHIHEAWVRAATRVDEVTAENRAYEARIDRASLAIDTAFGRLRRRVRRYGREEYLSRRAISREVVDHMAQQEHESAILHADL